MCYSAMVTQNAKDLGLRYDARIQSDLFEDLFRLRLEGSGAKVTKAMEQSFLDNPKTAQDKRIERYIRQFRTETATKLQQDLFAQTKRLADAERTLLTKTTKKAQNDQRVATDKIENIKTKLKFLESDELSSTDARIYPQQYAPLVLMQKGERIIAPFRYLLRPAGEPVDFDRKYNGAYNMRRDSLDRVFWWKNLYGKHHAFMEISAFWENVERKGKNAILKFTPDGDYPLIVPCIYDFNTEGDHPLSSFALLTDEPNPEVKAAGHDRTPVFMKEENIDLWLKTDQKSKSAYEPVFEEKQKTFFKHEVAA